MKNKEQIKTKLILKNMDIPEMKITQSKKVINNIQRERTSRNNISILNSSLDDYNSELLTKKFDFFDIGYLLLHAALGGLKIINFSEYSCSHEADLDLTTINIHESNGDIQTSCCCLYHCVEKTEKNLETKLKITNFINNKRFTQEFIDFLCLCTSFDLLERNVTFCKLKNHSWLNMKKDTVENIFEFSDLHKTYTNIKKNLYDKNVDNLIGVISRTLVSSSAITSKMYNNTNEILSKDNKDLVELSIDIGVDIMDLITRLKPIFEVESKSRGDKGDKSD
jgi:hypothetical protein